MIATIVTVYVKKENINDFIEATIKNHEGSRKEPGNIRFDVIQNTDDPSKFVLYEVFESQDAIEEHRKTAHYLTWRDTVKDWMEKPREAQRHHVIRPKGCEK